MKKSSDGSHLTNLGKWLVVSILLTTLPACGWLNKDKTQPTEEPPLPQPQQQAPSALFSVSENSGRAPFSVTFSDTSTQGSAPINRWQWDFGDGTQSDEQHPTHIYQRAGSFVVSLTVTSDHGSARLEASSPIEVEAADVLVQLAINAEDNASLPEVTITSTQLQIENSTHLENGLHQLQVRPESADAVLHIEAEGYLPRHLFLSGVESAQFAQVNMVKKAPPIMFDSLLGGTFYAKDGATVSIPSEALQRANGQPVTGEVALYITPVNTAEKQGLNSFPGSFFALPPDGNTDQHAQLQLLSYAVADITFEQGGEELQLKEGVAAELTLPLYANLDYQAQPLAPGDTIPLWYLQPSTGLWHFESEGQVVSNPRSPSQLALVATTSHFTTFNVDINPPGLLRQPLGESGNPTGDPENLFCALTLELLGAEQGKYYEYVLTQSTRFMPATRRSRSFVYQGQPIRHRLYRYSNAHALVYNKDIDGQTDFACGNADAINASITLGDVPPEFIDWNFRVTPNFTRTGSEPWAITSNTVYVGGYFTGANEVIIRSSQLTSPLILGKGIIVEHEYKLTDPSPISFEGTLTNQHGETRKTVDVSYIASAPPTLGITHANYFPSSHQTRIFGYNVVGADSLTIYHLGENINAQGTLIGTAALTDINFELTVEGLELGGYLRLEYTNQYDTAVEFIQVSGSSCPPFSDLCGPL